MNTIYNEDTIAAISTPTGEGGIGIVRVSGKDAPSVVDRVYKSKKGIRVSDFETNTIHYGHCFDQQGKLIDEVLVSFMKAPHTYTAEDVVEINCHGGYIAVRAILKAVIAAGARLADPGEFTRRAFMNGRIDLSQAEAVMDVIDAKTEVSLSYSVNQLSGGLSKRYEAMDAELLHLLTYIDAALDYPEYDVEEVTNETLSTSIDSLLSDVGALLDTAQIGKVYREGIDTVILGEPNVGKSSLLNTLINEEKALVTEIPGTTRDIVDAYLNIDGVPFHIIDTAGIRETEDLVEQLGVKRSMEMIDKAELVLYISDVSRETSDDEAEILEKIKDKNFIHIYNKIDLINDEVPDDGAAISVTTGEGLQQLKKTMVEKALSGSPASDSDDIVSNLRHVEKLNQVKDSLLAAKESLEAGMSVDLVAIDLKDALENLRAITGKSVGEDIIDQIFANFCLGK